MFSLDYENLTTKMLRLFFSRKRPRLQQMNLNSKFHHL